MHKQARTHTHTYTSTAQPPSRPSNQVDLSKKHGMEYLLVDGDGARLPHHPRVVKYLGHFTDTASKA